MRSKSTHVSCIRYLLIIPDDPPVGILFPSSCRTIATPLCRVSFRSVSVFKGVFRVGASDVGEFKCERSKPGTDETIYSNLEVVVGTCYSVKRSVDEIRVIHFPISTP